MSEPKDDELELDLELDLELEHDAPGVGAAADEPATGAAPLADAAPAADVGTLSEALAPAAAGAVAVAEASPAVESADDEGLPGQWVWQFAAPAPLPPFSGAFFSGRALAELYAFFAAALLVIVGTLLPWGPSLAWLVERAEPTVGYAAPPAGYATPAGALCLMLALWLLFTASYGIYTGRQKILPVFLMLWPAWLSWGRALDAWSELGAVETLGTMARVERWFEVAGTGVLLTLVGSSIVALQLVFVILKLMKKKPAAEGEGRARRAKSDKPATAEAPAAAPAGADAVGGPEPDKDKDKDKGGRRGRRR